MLRNTLIAAVLLAASGVAMADHDDHIYGRVLTIEPDFVTSFGGGHYQDGFRVRYEFGGQQYWTYSQYRPNQVIWVPQPVGYVIHHDRRDWHAGWNDRWHDRHDDDRWHGCRDGRWYDHRDRDHDRY